MTEALRIIDANFNRAREALRVIEDYARFVLDDAAAAAAVKTARHDLGAIVRALGAESPGAPALLEARDILNDAGRDVKTPTELTRGSIEDVVRAAFGRLTEATRSIGEYGKLISPEAAAATEALRYRGYELEQRIVLRGTLRARFRAVRLYVLVTAALCRGDWLATTEAAIRGGAGCIQLREKELSDGELLRRAQALRALTARNGALFIMNDRPDLARLAGADGVHVGQDDLSVCEARRIAGAALLVGKSTHTPEQFAAALAEEPDYAAIGPMFASPTKPQAHIAGPETLAQCATGTELPIVAIGGITAANAGPLFAAGASCVGVCSAVISAANPEAAAREIGAARPAQIDKHTK